MTCARNRSGIVLIAVLTAVVLLSLAAYQYSELMIGEYRATDSSIRAAQARTIAISGIHFAAAALADQATVTNKFNNNLQDNPDAFRGVEVQSDDRPRFAGRFSLMAPPAVDDALNGSTTTRFGVLDESGKINVNALVALNPDTARSMLLKLPNVTDEIVDAIIDWIDADDEQRPNGAENQYYSSLSPGFRCKNGPLDSLEELLLVKGVTPQLLFGNDKNRNGRTDANEDEGNGFDPGWSAYLTVYSRELNRDIDNQPRIYLNDTDVNGLYDKLNTAVGEELATWIVAYRLYGGSNSSSGNGGSSTSGSLSKSMLDFNRRPTSISSIMSLIDGTVSIPQSGSAGGGGTTSTTTVTISGNNVTMTAVTVTSNQSGSGQTGGGQSGGSSGSGGGRGTSGSGGSGSSGSGGGGAGGGSNNRTYPSPLLDQTKRKQLLPILLDKCTTRSDAEIPARINVMTASKAVLTCLPGLDEADVQTIISSRPTAESADLTDPAYQTIAWLITDANLPVSKVRALERYVTNRSQTYRVQSLGYFDQGGPVARVEAVVDTNGGQPRIIYFRDLGELGRGMEIPR